MNLLGMKRKLLPLSGPMGGGGKGGGGGGSPGPQQVTSTTTSSNIPEYARPYVENMLQSAQAQIYNDDMTSFRPYEAYSSDPNKYFAEFSPMQQRAQEATYNLQMPGQFGLGSELAGQAGIQSVGAKQQADFLGSQALGYGQAGSMYGSTGAEQAMAAARGAQQQAQMYGAQGAGYGAAAAGLSPEAQRYGQQAADIGQQGLGYGAMGTGYGAEAAARAQQGYGAGAQFAQQATDPAATKAYMSPYMQNVVDYQKTQAARDYQIAQQARQAGAVAKGAFGGSRQAIMDSEAQRNLMSQLQGIEGMGAQEAFKNAQAQQQFGANLGLQGLQAGYQGTGMGIQGAGMGLQGLGTAMQGQEAGLRGLGQAGNLLGQGMQGAGVGLSGVGQQLGAGQLGLQGTAQGIQGAQAGLQGVQGAVGSGQYGLQGLGQGIQAGSALGNLGGQQLGANQNIINAQSTMGGQQQAMEQQKINQQIQDFATQQQYPFMQLGMLNNLLRGLPMQSMSTQQYQAAPSMLTQGLGAAGTLAGAYRAFGAKEGGVVKGLKAGGAVAKYAAGGNTSSEVVNSVRGKLAQMDEAQLQQIMKTSSSQEVREMAAEVLMEKKMAMQAEQQAPQVPMSEGIAALPAPAMDQMAGGGIVAFAEGDLVNEEEDLKYQNMIQRQREAAGITGPANTKFKEFLASQVGALPGMKEQAKGQMMMDYFSNFGTQPGGALFAGLKAAKEVGPQFKATADKLNKAEMDLMKGQADLEQADRLEKLGLVDKANALRDKYDDRAAAYKRTMDAARIQAQASAASANRATDLDRDADAYFNLLVGEGMDPKDPKTKALARQKAREGANPYAQGKLDLQTEAAITNREKTDDKLAALRTRLVLADEKDKSGILTDMETRRKEIRAEITKAPAPGTTPPPAPGAPANARPMVAAPPAAVDMLKNNDTPEMRKNFDAIFGAGAAAKALGK